jgi:hypothetical protein
MPESEARTVTTASSATAEAMSQTLNLVPSTAAVSTVPFVFKLASMTRTQPVTTTN